ncbi:ABC transporter ATP-binding protein [Ancylobacter sp. FA202]|uniref:ABC transporter ATP-binding protein n=1 Tax=Ancylobacter sp. FA202 TaxID=1111106 RepID=UPI0003822216|nr:ABC transporter ATP-binding protein [Ancylobacter sp. FA202]
MIASVPSGLAARGISKRFAHQVLHSVGIDIAPGELVAITGPSGAGKSTFCRILAGLERPDAGSVTLGGRDLASVPPQRRRVALMFESYALYPHLTVRGNALSPLQAPGGRLDPAGAAARVDEVLELLEIRHLGERLPGALSGGQKQRVALARTLVQAPDLYILDEPISHLDAKLRHKLRGEIRRRLARQEAPTLWSTPDGMEALSVGDRVVVIDGGHVEQVGTPEDIWQRPASTRVARLLGDPPMNLIDGQLARENGTLFFTRRELRLALPPALARAAEQAGSEAVSLGVRPDDIAFAAPDTSGAVRAEIYSNEPFGKHAIVTLDLGALLAKAKTSMAIAASLGSGAGDGIGRPVGLMFPKGGLALFDGTTGRALPGT